MNAWSETSADVLSVLAIDLPEVKPEWLEQMAGIAREYAVTVVPRHAQRFEPVVAAWHRSALSSLEGASRDGRSLQDVCEKLMNDGRLRVFEPGRDQMNQLANLNTPEDALRLG